MADLLVGLVLLIGLVILFYPVYRLFFSNGRKEQDKKATQPSINLDDFPDDLLTEEQKAEKNKKKAATSQSYGKVDYGPVVSQKLMGDHVVVTYENGFVEERFIQRPRPVDPDLDNKIFKLERKIKEEYILLHHAQGMVDQAYGRFWQDKRDQSEVNIERWNKELAVLKSQKTT